MINIKFIDSETWSQITPWSLGCKMAGANLTGMKTLLISLNSIRVLGWSYTLKGICLFFLWDYISACYQESLEFLEYVIPKLSCHWRRRHVPPGRDHFTEQQLSTVGFKESGNYFVNRCAVIPGALLFHWQRRSRADFIWFSKSPRIWRMTDEKGVSMSSQLLLAPNKTVSLSFEPLEPDNAFSSYEKS